MESLLKTTAILVVCLFLQACSYSVEFVLVNESDAAIEVEYKADMKGHMSEQPIVPEAFVPQTMSYGKWSGKHERKDWAPLANTDYQVDLDDGIFRLKIPPRTALRLAEVSDLVFFRDQYKDFELKSLAVRGPYGNFAFEGVQLFREFTKNGRSICFISYKN